jgi:hypothetical protein
MPGGTAPTRLPDRFALRSGSPAQSGQAGLRSAGQPHALTRPNARVRPWRASWRASSRAAPAGAWIGSPLSEAGAGGKRRSQAHDRLALQPHSPPSTVSERGVGGIGVNLTGGGQ